MKKKVPWEDIYRDFRLTHPNLRNRIIGWQPHGYLTIVIRFDDNTSMVYDYLTKYCAFTT